MNAPLTSGKFPLNGRNIALVGTLAIQMLIAPHEASARGGPFHLFPQAEAATVTPSRTEAATVTPGRTETFGGCGGKRYRDPNTHRCRGPADFGN
jgi:hypothetical protein